MSKNTQLIAACLAAAALCSAPAWASPDHDHSPKHGGVVSTVKEIDYELVARPERITLHVRDHGKVVDLNKASAKLTLLTAGQKQEVTLAPAAATLQATGQFNVAKGTRALALITLPGKPAVTARFELK
jgi:hypothetical protein